MPILIPDSPDVLLRRKGVAEALRARGFPCTEKTLATWVTRGGGPPFRRWGKIPLYRLSEVLAWAEGRMSRPVSCSAELDRTAAVAE